MNQLKTIVKHMDGTRELKRHVYLAYQWIKRKDLTKAENPARTIQCIRINLLLELINFLKPNFVTYQELESHLKESGFKYKTIHLEHEYTILQKYTNKTIFNNRIYFVLSPDYKELNEALIYHHIRFLFGDTPMNPKIEKNKTSFNVIFSNSKGSSLYLTIANTAKYLDPMEFTFVLKNKSQSQGVLRFTRTWGFRCENELFNFMIEQLLKDEKFGESNENK